MRWQAAWQEHLGTDPAWFTCHGQCYSYASIKIWSPANKTLLCNRCASNRSRFWGLSQVPAGRASFTYLQAGGCSSSDTPSEKEEKDSTKGRQVVPGQKPCWEIRASSLIAGFVLAPRGWCFRILRSPHVQDGVLVTQWVSVQRLKH